MNLTRRSFLQAMATVSAAIAAGPAVFDSALAETAEALPLIHWELIWQPRHPSEPPWLLYAHCNGPDGVTYEWCDRLEDAWVKDPHKLAGVKSIGERSFSKALDAPAGLVVEVPMTDAGGSSELTR